MAKETEGYKKLKPDKFFTGKPSQNYGGFTEVWCYTILLAAPEHIPP